MKFLILANALSVGGGISSSQLNFTNVLIREGHQVDLLNFTDSEELDKRYNKKVRLLNLNYRAKILGLQFSDIKKAKGIKKIKLMFYAVLKKITHKTELWQRICFRKSFYSGYDVAVAFRQTPLNFWFVNKKTDAKVKIGFWHVDPDYYTDIDKWAYTIKNLDYLACVSNAVKDKMMKRYPQFKEKMETVYNIFDAEEIIDKSKEFNPNYNKTFNIVTVARIEFTQKQLDFIPIIAKQLKSLGHSFHWTIVGGGCDIEKLKELMIKNGVEREVSIVGKKENPYPYVKHADLFVLTSIWETYGMVLTESLILGTPCIAGYYPALPEIILDGENGIIAENSIDGIKEKIEGVINNKDMYKKIKLGATSFKYDYKVAYKQFMELCNGKI